MRATDQLRLWRSHIAVALHHLILAASDRDATARYLQDLLELPEPWENGVFLSFQLSDLVVINVASPPGVQIQAQHYAFLVDDDHFDRIRARLDRDGISYSADPRGHVRSDVGQVNPGGTGRRLYFVGPDGHMLEVLTARYDNVPESSSLAT